MHKSSLIGSGGVLITEKGLPHLNTWTNDLVPDIDNNPEFALNAVGRGPTASFGTHYG